MGCAGVMPQLFFRLKLLAITALWICIALVSARAIAETARVAVAANFTATMEQLAAAFEQRTEHRLELISGSSGKLYAQIVHGAPFDLFFSADQQKPRALLHQGLAIAESQFTYAQGSLVLWGAADKVEQALHSNDFDRLVLPNPKLAPYGRAAQQVLANLDLEKTTRSRWVTAENVAQAYQFIASGSADMGFVALAYYQALEPEGTAWVVPQSLYSPIRQDVVLTLHGKENAAAKAFLRFVRSQQAQALIVQSGYQLSTLRVAP